MGPFSKNYSCGPFITYGTAAFKWGKIRDVQLQRLSGLNSALALFFGFHSRRDDF